MPGIQFKLWPLYAVTRHPMVQIPAGQIGVVIAQVGAPLPVGAKSAVYKPHSAISTTSRPSSTGRPERRAAPGAAARHGGADPSGRLPGHHQATPSTACRSTRNMRALDAQGGLKPASFGLSP